MGKDGVPFTTTTTPTLRGGIPRKRILRACNECRLHKARCDGRETCETCRRYNRICHYSTTQVDRVNPAGRIRALEDSLVKARHHIADLQNQLPKEISSKANQTVYAHSTLNAPQDTPITVESRADTATSIGVDLIEALLRPLSHHGDIRNLTCSKESGEFWVKSAAERKHFYTALCQLPVHATMIETVHAAFDGVFGLCNIVVAQDFYVAAQALYDCHPMSYTQEHADFVPLFFGVLALGLIQGTGKDLEESQFYLAATFSKINLAEGHLSLPSLQAGLSTVLYLVNTSKPDLARHQLNAITSSPTVQNSLCRQTSQSFQAQSPTTILTIPDQILWLICYLDMHTSDLLGFDPLLDSSTATSTTTPAINTAAHNVALCARSDNSFLSEVSLAMAVELERLIQRTGTRNADVVTTSSKNQGCPNSVQIDFATWEHIFQCIFPDDDDNLDIALAHNELRMHYHLAQIVLLHGHLAYHSESPATDDPNRLDHICKGRACVIAASNAVLFTVARLERMQMTALTWLSAYTVFISTITLLMAISRLDDANIIVRDAIERTIQIAFHILRHTRYHASRGKNTYLDFLAILAARLKIDFEPPPVDSVPASTDASFYTCDSLGPGSSVRSSSAPTMNRDITTIPLERWWQWPETENFTQEWGFD